MHLGDSLCSSFLAIWSHKLRSFLTLLGIVIGVAAVITMFSTVSGIKKFIYENLDTMAGTDCVNILAGESDAMKNAAQGKGSLKKSLPLSWKDYTSLRDNVFHTYSYPFARQWANKSKTVTPEWVMASFTTNGFFYSDRYPIGEGRYFNDYEIKNGQNVCVIGYLYGQKNYPRGNAIGKSVRLWGNNFKIIGVLKADILDTGSEFNFSRWTREWQLKGVYIPASLITKYSWEGDKFDYFRFRTESELHVEELGDRLTQQLLLRHNMMHDFHFELEDEDVVKTKREVEENTNKWNVTLSTIASISLLVGGIGLLSTLLVSINERMLEIGIRKSVGSTNMNIFMIFLVESIVLAMCGAVIGVLVAGALVIVIGQMMSTPIGMSVTGTMIGLGFSLFIGVVSGLYPAIKASRVDPIKAIFYFE